MAKVSVVSPKDVVRLWSSKVSACFCCFVTKLSYENARKFPVTRKLMLESSIQELIACATLVCFHCSIHIFAGFVNIFCLTPCLFYSNSMSTALILNQVQHQVGSSLCCRLWKLGRWDGLWEKEVITFRELWQFLHCSRIVSKSTNRRVWLLMVLVMLRPICWLLRV